MSVNLKIREALKGIADDEALYFENPSFDNSIVGVTPEGKLVYEWNKMIDELADDDGISAEEATEFIDYNTLRSIGYWDMAPVVIDTLYVEMAWEEVKWEEEKKKYVS